LAALREALRAAEGGKSGVKVKGTLRLVALAGTTIFGIISISQIAVLVYIYIDTYRLGPPPFAMPGYHQFPVYRLNRDLRDAAPTLFAFICCLIWYVRSVKLEKENSK
jgi:hypothetical protein